MCCEGEDNTCTAVMREARQDPAESENLACVDTLYAEIGRPGKLPRRWQMVEGRYQ